MQRILVAVILILACLFDENQAQTVPPDRRVNCDPFPGGDQQRCLSRGCIYDTSLDPVILSCRVINSFVRTPQQYPYVTFLLIPAILSQAEGTLSCSKNLHQASTIRMEQTFKSWSFPITK